MRRFHAKFLVQEWMVRAEIATNMEECNDQKWNGLLVQSCACCCKIFLYIDATSDQA